MESIFFVAIIALAVLYYGHDTYLWYLQILVNPIYFHAKQGLIKAISKF